jgi:hypothetical protein
MLLIFIDHACLGCTACSDTDRPTLFTKLQGERHGSFLGEGVFKGLNLGQLQSRSWWSLTRETLNQ